MKIFCRVLVLCVSLLLGINVVPIIGNAQELSGIEPKMTYIQSYKVELTISDSGLASITGVVTGKPNTTSTSVKAILQKYVSEDYWEDVETWEDSNDSFRTSIAATYQVSRGTYRVVMTCAANTETKTVTSVTRIY